MPSLDSYFWVIPVTSARDAAHRPLATGNESLAIREATSEATITPYLLRFLIWAQYVKKTPKQGCTKVQTFKKVPCVSS
jgi:hypothetical protein